ncbi:inactive hydroxysteroid dehydrogenase-like protein 1 isoform X3 [Cherax quadricarinatus]|uniref:inactive hydroxysteroid dehydrogenase-like protein 1 isoform X3 n=1 Tax=Cherax quadricarinatus TaxID=27406 RepID=UPI00387EBAE5
MAVSVDSARWLINEMVKVAWQVEEVLSWVGIFYLGKVTLGVAWEVGTGLRTHLWSKMVTRDLPREYGGRWAVVTGATDGIGKAYATELAKNGMNIILVSRTQEKLENVAQEIRGRYAVETEIVRADFSVGRTIYDDISKHLEGKEIGILVNNVGVAGSALCLFIDAPEDDIWALVNVNVASVPAMTKLVLPGMIARRKGAIVNISSAAEIFSLPLLQLYCASKAFVNRFSEIVEFECRSSGITVQTLVPCTVWTNMNNFDPAIHKEGWVSPFPSRYAYHALSTLGYARCTTGYWAHSLQTKTEKIETKEETNRGNGTERTGGQ